MFTQRVGMRRSLGLIALSALLLFGCQAAATEAPTEEPTELPTELPAEEPAEVPVEVPVPTPDAPTLDFSETSPNGLTCVPYVDGRPAPGVDTSTPVTASAFFVQNQVIVIGPLAEINTVIADLFDQGIVLTPLELCDLRYLDTLPDPPERELDLPFTPTRSDGGIPPAPLQQKIAEQAVVLFQVEGVDVASAVTEINQRGNELNVFADPNYLVGPLAVSPCGNPDDAVGDPFEVGGSPFEVGGSPFEVGGSGKPGAEADADIFWEQWAFAQIQVGPVYSDLETPKKGRGISAVVFDSWVDKISEPIVTDAQSFSIDQIVVASRNRLSPPNPDKVVDVREHGVFVAGLINAVAPEASIKLYGVLNEYGCGDLMTLIQALHMSVLAGVDNERRLDGTVFNLSLGVHQPRETEKQGLPADLITLEKVLSEAHSLGAVIVAAAGNDSVQKSIATTHLPADYGYVIGVAASNPKRARSCYSNSGNVAAPGGDGDEYTDEAEGKTYDCAPLAFLCGKNQADCPYGVISYSPSADSDYRFWSGTSFAAPLVSGLAALTLEAGHAPEDVPGMMTSMTQPGTGFGNDEEVIQVPESIPAPGP